MVKINTTCILVALILFSQLAEAQNRYAVHYKYKPQDNLTLLDPSAFLTEKAIERRIRHEIPLDSLDLPVSVKYIEGIEPFIQEILYQSHWFNASVVVADPIKIEKITALPFVEKVVLAAPGFNPAGRWVNKPKDNAGLNLNFKLKARKTDAPFNFQNELLGFSEMHEGGFKGKDITVAVFDAGFPGVDVIPAFSHLFDNNQLIGTRDFVHTWNDNVFTKNQHGTNVLSLIAADDPELLVAGAPEANYILCITEEVPTEFRIEEYNWVKAAEYADSLGVDIINSSLGYLDFDDSSMDYSVEDLDGETALITLGANIASDKGILIVNSAGNYGSRGEASLTAPADAKGILSIGAVDENLATSVFSSQGPTADGRIKPELSTYGSGVYLIRFNGTIGRSNGTSFSSPQIAALAAGVWSARPEWTKDQLINNLLRSATQAEAPDNLLGYGIPNFSRAYYGEILEIFTAEEKSEWSIFPNPLEGHNLFVSFGNQEEGEFTLYEMNGNVIRNNQIKRASNREAFEVYLPALPSGMYFVEMRSGKDFKRSKLIKR